jgi:predicted lipid-binding transport protein (Tim44 family)
LEKELVLKVKPLNNLIEFLKEAVTKQPTKIKETFDENDQKEFLKGAKIAYETIITDFSDNDNKITTSKPLLNNEIYNQFNEALKRKKCKRSLC